MRGGITAFAGSAFAALFLFFGLASANAQESFARQPLTLETADGTRHDFTVELAETADQRQQGLMFRKSMAPDEGMLFDFKQARRVTMWMMNTLIPLDMLFIDETGTVRTIHRDAVPESQAIIDSQVPVTYVLELNAGTAAALSIAPGDHVIADAIPRSADPK